MGVKVIEITDNYQAQIGNRLISDASSTIGHIIRDLILAKQYLKSSIFFATQELKRYSKLKDGEFLL